jgi:hypothetical protein
VGIEGSLAQVLQTEQGLHCLLRKDGGEPCHSAVSNVIWVAGRSSTFAASPSQGAIYLSGQLRRSTIDKAAPLRLSSHSTRGRQGSVPMIPHEPSLNNSSNCWIKSRLLSAWGNANRDSAAWIHFHCPFYVPFCRKDSGKSISKRENKKKRSTAVKMKI